MKYMFLIYEPETVYANMTQGDYGAVLNAHNGWTADAIARGVFVSGDALQPTPTATTVRVRDGKTVNTDGPFAETKEQLGGYYILNCKDLNEALEFAAKLPGVERGSIEIRPIMEFSA